MADDRLLTDEELCEVLKISRATLHRHLTNGPPRGGLDLREVQCFTLGGQRRWVRDSLNEKIKGATE